MFYGYNPVHLITFFVFWFYSIEKQSDKLVRAFLDTLEAPNGFAFDGFSRSQNVDWPLS